MARPALEVADILRDHGPAWREANRGHVSLEQLKVMSAIERCRTAALGGHVARCENAACGYTEIAYNSCGNRHCPKCQAAASRQWLAEREAELLPVPYFHVVYTLPSELRHIAYQNRRVVYNLLMKAAAETTLAIASDPKRLGARIGVTAVLHTAHNTLSADNTDVQVFYPFHPLHGVTLRILRRPKRGDGAVCVIDPAGRRLKIPIWMLLPECAEITISQRPHLGKQALLSLASLITSQLDSPGPR